MRAIDSIPSIKREFSLKLRADCVHVVQTIPSLCFSSYEFVNFNSSHVDFGWSAIAAVLMSIFDCFLERNCSFQSHRDSKNHVDNPGLEEKEEDLLWDFMLQSEHHEIYMRDNDRLFAFEENIWNKQQNATDYKRP